MTARGSTGFAGRGWRGGKANQEPRFLPAHPPSATLRLSGPGSPIHVVSGSAAPGESVAETLDGIVPRLTGGVAVNHEGARRVPLADQSSHHRGSPDAVVGNPEATKKPAGRNRLEFNPSRPLNDP